MLQALLELLQAFFLVMAVFWGLATVVVIIEAILFYAKATWNIGKKACSWIVNKIRSLK